MREIDKSNGILVDGELYFSVGMGGQELIDDIESVFGEGSRYKVLFSHPNRDQYTILSNGWSGMGDRQAFYLKQYKADVWEKFRKSKELEPKAKSLTPEGATYLGKMKLSDCVGDENLLYGVLLNSDMEKDQNDSTIKFYWKSYDDWEGFDVYDSYAGYVYTKPIDIAIDLELVLFKKKLGETMGMITIPLSDHEKTHLESLIGQDKFKRISDDARQFGKRLKSILNLIKEELT